MLLRFDKLLHSDKFEAHGFLYRKVGPNSAIRYNDFKLEVFEPEEIVVLL